MVKEVKALKADPHALYEECCGFSVTWEQRYQQFAVMSTLKVSAMQERYTRLVKIPHSTVLASFSNCEYLLLVSVNYARERGVTGHHCLASRTYCFMDGAILFYSVPVPVPF